MTTDFKPTLTLVKEELGKELSPEQEALVLHSGSPLNGDACAGSGKTTTGIVRLLYLQRELQVNPANIMYLTFNKEAQVEVEQRYNDFCRTLGLQRGVKFSTYHALCYRIVRSAYKNQYQVAEEGPRLRELRRIGRRHIDGLDDKQFENLAGILSYRVNNLLTFEELTKTAKFLECGFSLDQVRNVWNDFRTFKEENKLLDFDDMQLIAYKLLSDYPQIREAFANAYEWWFADEYQDSSMIQVRILQLLVKDQAKLTTIGDGDQAIYEFRGASDVFITRFNDYFPGSTRLELPTNYRCPENILAPMRRVIEKNAFRTPKRLLAAAPGGKVLYVPTRTALASSNYIATAVVNLYNERVHPKDIAVIYRNNSQPMYVIDMLLQAGVPIRVSSADSLVYNHFITADLMGMLELATKPADSRLFSKVATRLIRYVNKGELQRAVKIMESTGQCWYDVFEDGNKNIMEAEETMNAVADLLQRNEPMKKSLELLEPNYRKYLESLSDRGYIDLSYDDIMDMLEYLKYLGSTRTFLDFKSYIVRAKGLIKNFKEDRNAVTLTTMHQCKGLEFAHVFLLHMAGEILPNNSFLKKVEKDLGADEAAKRERAERKLFYVAGTRAKESLTVTYLKDDPCPYVLDMIEPGKSLDSESEELYNFFIRKFQ